MDPRTSLSLSMNVKIIYSFTSYPSIPPFLPYIVKSYWAKKNVKLSSNVKEPVTVNSRNDDSGSSATLASNRTLSSIQSLELDEEQNCGERFPTKKSMSRRWSSMTLRNLSLSNTPNGSIIEVRVIQTHMTISVDPPPLSLLTNVFINKIKNESSAETKLKRSKSIDNIEQLKAVQK